MFQMLRCHTRSSHLLHRNFFSPSRFLIWHFPLFSSNRHRDLTPAPDTCNTTTQPKVDPLVNATSAFELFAILQLMSDGQHIDAASNASQKWNLTQTFNKVRQQMNVLATVRGCAYKAWEGAVCCWNAPQGQRNKKLEWSWVCAQTHTRASLKFIGWLFPDKAIKKTQNKTRFLQMLIFIFQTL